MSVELVVVVMRADNSKVCARRFHARALGRVGAGLSQAKTEVCTSRRVVPGAVDLRLLSRPALLRCAVTPAEELLVRAESQRAVELDDLVLSAEQVEPEHVERVIRREVDEHGAAAGHGVSATRAAVVGGGPQASSIRDLPT
jgi:hypothetical protein